MDAQPRLDRRPQALLYETHSHTPLCRHANGLPEEYAAVAYRRNLKGLIVTCHNPMPRDFASKYRMSIEELDAYESMVMHAKNLWSGRVDVRLGMESEYVPGIESYLEKLHTLKPFKYILGSVHPQITEYRTEYFRNDIVAYQKLYFEHLAMAAETKLFDTLSHPDLVKICSPDCWNPSSILTDIQHALDRIARAGTAMELNTSGLLKQLNEMHPGELILNEIRARNIPMVIGGDAHQPERAGADFDVALRLLQRLGFTTVSLFLERHQRQDIPIADALASLTPLTSSPAPDAAAPHQQSEAQHA